MLRLEAEGFAEPHPACRTVVFEWSVWSGVGMGEELGVLEALSRQGVAPVAVPDGVAMFEALLAESTAPASVVVAGRFGPPPTVDLAVPTLPPLLFLDSITTFYPGVEIVGETHLASDQDPYLADHILSRTLLFPAVLGTRRWRRQHRRFAAARYPLCLRT